MMILLNKNIHGIIIIQNGIRYFVLYPAQIQAFPAESNTSLITRLIESV